MYAFSPFLPRTKILEPPVLEGALLPTAALNPTPVQARLYVLTVPVVASGKAKRSLAQSPLALHLAELPCTHNVALFARTHAHCTLLCALLRACTYMHNNTRKTRTCMPINTHACMRS